MFKPEKMSLRRLALPILMENILRTTVGLVNIVFLSRVSDGTVSAVSISNQYIMLCNIITMAVANGSIIYINQAIGMNSYEKTGRLATMALLVNGAVGALFGLLFLTLSSPLLIVMEMERDIFNDASLYMKIVGGAMAVSCTETVLSSLCRSSGHTKAPLLINLTVNLINIAGCFIVVFTPWGKTIPSVAGIAVVNVISRVCGMFLAVYIFSKSSIKVSWSHLKPFPWKELKMALSVGIPNGMNNIAYSMSQLATTAIITQTGMLMVAAKTYITNIVHYVALVGMACAQAGMILIGYKLGAGDIESVEKLRKRVTRIALISNMSFSLVFIALRMPLLRLFTSDETILTIAAGVMIFDFVVEIGRALNNTLSTSLQACGDVVFQLIINQLSGWVIAVGGAYFFGIVMGWGLYGVWTAFAIDELTRGLTLLYRWNKKSWLKKVTLNNPLLR